MTPWDDAPPSKEELESLAQPASSWADEPPSKEELQAISGPIGDASRVGFGSYATSQVPILGTLQNTLSSGAIAGINKLMGDERDLAAIYDQEKRQREADLQAYAEQNPGLGLAGTIIGGVALPGAGGGLARQVVVNAGVAGADAKMKGEDALKAAGLGGGITAAFGGVGKALSGMPSLRDYAARRAVKAAGGMTKDMRALEQKGLLESTGRELLDQGIVKFGSSLEDIAEGASKAKEAAGKAIGDAIEKADEGVQKARDYVSKSSIFNAKPSDPLVTGGVSDAIKKQQSKLLDDVTDSLGFSTKSVASRIRNELLAPNVDNPFLSGEVKKLEGLVNKLDEGGAKSLSEGLGMKSSQRRLTNFDSETVPQGFKQDVYRIVKEELERSVGQAAKIDDAVKNLTPDEMVEAITSGRFRDPTPLADVAKGPAKDFAKANKQYAIMANTEDMAQRRFGAAQSNRENSLTDTIAEGFGLMHGGLGGAAALGAANKAMRRWGSSTAAVGANETAKLLEAMPDVVKRGASAARSFVAENQNAARSATNIVRDAMRPSMPVPDFAGHEKIKSVAEQRPELLGKYGPTLNAAIQRGGNSFAATHFMLQQRDPEYRELLKRIEEGGH